MRSGPKVRRARRELMRSPRSLCGAVLGLVMLAWVPARAGEVSLAVAANFTAPAKDIVARFEPEAGCTVDLSFGSSGQLYAQITQGAPFDILLSADAERPKIAEAEGLALPGTRFTYAIGKLVLWSADPGMVDRQGDVLRHGAFARLAIVNPDVGPYGMAAIEALKALGLYDQIAPKIVKGQTVAQAHQFIASGNAELGFVALSQLSGEDSGSRWVVPGALYSPIRQDAVLLKAGGQNGFAKAFLVFLKSQQAAKIIQRYGYDAVPGS